MFGRTSRFLLFAVFSIIASGVANADFIITPTFDSSITSDPNAATIESTIGSVIRVYESTFSNPINVSIYFQEGGGLGSSLKGLYYANYTGFKGALAINQSISHQLDQATALANLPAVLPASNISFVLATADIKALGGPSLPGVTARDGNSYDGIISLNTSITNPGGAGPYSLAAATMHEINEVLGLGSGVGTSLFLPEDLYRYDGTGTHTNSFTTTGDDAWFSIDGVHNLIQFNQRQQYSIGDFGDWHLSDTPRVQDAYATPGADPTLGIELTALDVIGYNRTPSVPEPSSVAMLGFGVIGLAMNVARRRRG